jgi:hypothetical protein
LRDTENWGTNPKVRDREREREGEGGRERENMR